MLSNISPGATYSKMNEEVSGKEVVPSGQNQNTKKIITGILFNHLIFIYRILGIVENVSLEDSDFEKLRLSFNRQPKKAKAIPKRNLGDAAEVNGYQGPWANFNENSTVACGPSEVLAFIYYRIVSICLGGIAGAFQKD